eukprot:s1305_g4.t1
MCLALARTVATKVILRAGGAVAAQASASQQWQMQYQQAGYVGSSVLFHNGDSVMPSMLCSGEQDCATAVVQLRLRRARFLEQAEALRRTNIVYANAKAVDKVDADKLTEWLGGEDDVVPEPVLDCVVTVPVGQDGPGKMRQEGPAQATAGNIAHTQEETVFAVEPEVKDFNEDDTIISTSVVLMLQKLEELEAAGSRSVAVEMASLMDGDAVLRDHVGRKRILDLCNEIHQCCQKLSAASARAKLEGELRDAVMGRSRWLEPETEGDKAAESGVIAAAEGSHEAQHLFVARDKKPLSLFDWTIWSMAKPRLWRYGDAANLFDLREAPLTTAEWAACILRCQVFILFPIMHGQARRAAAEKAKEEVDSDDDTAAPNASGEEDAESTSESEEVGSPRSTVSKGTSVVFSCEESTYVPGEDGAMAMEHDEADEDLFSCSDINPEDKGEDSDSDTLELPGEDDIRVQIRKRRRMKSMDDEKDRVKARRAKGASKAASSKKPSKGKKASFRRGGKKQPKVANGLGSPEEYRGYDLTELPTSARPQPNRKHRGLHSYTVSTAVRDVKSNELCEVLVDVLLQKKAYYIKKCPSSGKTGQVSWNKIGNAKHAWAVAMDRARCGNVL